MKKKFLALSVLCLVILAGCMPANITAAKWDSGVNNDSLQTRCERVDMRNNQQMEKVFKKYDGWKLVYVSEYTTKNRFGTDAAVCFERSSASQ